MAMKWLAVNWNPNQKAYALKPEEGLTLFCRDVGKILSVEYGEGNGATLQLANRQKVRFYAHTFEPVALQAVRFDFTCLWRFPNVPERVPCRFRKHGATIVSIARREFGSRYGRQHIDTWACDPRVRLLVLYSFLPDAWARQLAEPIPTRKEAMRTLRAFGALRRFPAQIPYAQAETLTSRILRTWSKRFPKLHPTTLCHFINLTQHTFLGSIKSAGTFAIPNVGQLLKALEMHVYVGFVREPENLYDPNAIRIVLGAHGAKLGYVPRAFAAQWAPLLDRGERLIGVCNGDDCKQSKAFGIDVFLWRPTPFDAITSLRLTLEHTHGPQEVIELFPQQRRLRRTWAQCRRFTIVFDQAHWETFALPLLQACNLLNWREACNQLHRDEGGEHPFDCKLWSLRIEGTGEGFPYATKHTCQPPQWETFARFLEESCDSNQPKGRGRLTFRISG